MEGAADRTSADEQLRKAAADAMMVDIGGSGAGATAMAPAAAEGPHGLGNNGVAYLPHENCQPRKSIVVPVKRGR